MQLGHLVEILYTIPARKMIQFAKRAAAHPLPLVRQVGGDPLVKPRHRLGKAQLMQIPHHIRAESTASVV
jgi:hypothetical protein